MQISKPNGLVVSDKVAKDRKMKVKQETIIIKSALAMGLERKAVNSSLPADGRKLIEVPYCMMACLHRLKLN